MSTKKYKIEKSKVEIYRLRPAATENSDEWANITIDAPAGTNTGRIAIDSAFGSWAFSSNSCGESFKQWLCALDKYYVAKQVGADQELDIDGTLQEYLNVLNSIYTSDQEDYKDIRREINKFEKEKSNFKDKTSFACCLQSNGKQILSMLDGRPAIYVKNNPDFELFWKHIWPVLIEQFKNETMLEFNKNLNKKK